MIILGVDPGLRVTGFGVIRQQGSQLVYLSSGVIRTPVGTLPERLKVILDGLNQVVAEHRPDQAAIEKVFVNVNPQSTLLLGHARGVAIAALVQNGVPVAEYTALQTKQATVGHGKADKSQVQAMVQRLLALSAMPGTDASDALACAICHAHAQRNLSGLKAMAPALGITGLRIRRGRLVG
jgi:crossover junction endodeoxyribonuclease RuvC